MTQDASWYSAWAETTKIFLPIEIMISKESICNF